MSRNVIDDGYTVAAYIAPVDRLHGEMEFSFRPMIAEETEFFTREDFKRRPASQAAQLSAAAVREHLVSWSECDTAGTIRPITVDAIRRLPWAVQNKLFNIVAGFIPYDPRPAGERNPDIAAEDEYASRLLKAASEQESIGVVAAEADEKN